MHTTKCLEIWVRFRSPNHAGQRISLGQVDTRTRYFQIEHDSVRLHIGYIDKDGDEVGSLNFNSAEVLEYSVEGYVK